MIDTGEWHVITLSCTQALSSCIIRGSGCNSAHVTGYTDIDKVIVREVYPERVWSVEIHDEIYESIKDKEWVLILNAPSVRSNHDNAEVKLLINCTEDDILLFKLSWPRPG